MRRTDSASPLARYLLAAYTLLVAYASMHPFSGWRDPGIAPFAFLGASLPRFITAFDVVANVLGYLPFGFFAVLALHPRLRGRPAVLAAFAAGALLSALVEAAQTYLPSRIASNVDLAANAAGALAGALAAAGLANSLLREDGLHALRYRLFRPGAQIDLGLVLLGLWVFSQLSPGTLLFGIGDLRPLFHVPTGTLYPAEHFIRVEALVTCANAAAVALLIAQLASPGQPVRGMFVLTMVLALAVRTLAYGLLFGPEDLLHWLTPGAGFGVAAGMLVGLVAVALPRAARPALCGFAIMAATVIVNIAPANPYLADSLATWQQGHFLNFNGLTRVLSAAWPFVALIHILALAAGRNRARH